MCTTQNPRMIRSGALNPAGGRGGDRSRPRWSPASEDPAPSKGTGTGAQGGYRRLTAPPPVVPLRGMDINKKMGINTSRDTQVAPVLQPPENRSTSTAGAASKSGIKDVYNTRNRR